MRTFLLVPSPLLGPATWRPVAAELRARGGAAAIAGFSSTVRDGADVLTAVVGAADGLDEVVLVAHSNAGLLTPQLAQVLGARACVYVDAALPGPGPDTALAPEAFLSFLTGLAVDGVLPPWTQWWEDVGPLFPSPELRAAVEAEQPRMPLSYFSSRVPVPEGWASGRNAYLAFGTTYADESAFARASGWPMTELAGTHLHALHDPAGVAAAIVDLADLLGVC